MSITCGKGWTNSRYRGGWWQGGEKRGSLGPRPMACGNARPVFSPPCPSGTVSEFGQPWPASRGRDGGGFAGEKRVRSVLGFWPAETLTPPVPPCPSGAVSEFGQPWPASRGRDGGGLPGKNGVRSVLGLSYFRQPCSITPIIKTILKPFSEGAGWPVHGHLHGSGTVRVRYGYGRIPVTSQDTGGPGKNSPCLRGYHP